MAKTPDPTKDKEFNATLRRALATPHKPHAKATKPLRKELVNQSGKGTKETAAPLGKAKRSRSGSKKP